MKDRCLLSAYRDRDTGKDVVKFGIPLSSINDNMLELRERSDGSRYTVLYGGGFYSTELLDYLVGGTEND